MLLARQIRIAAVVYLLGQSICSQVPSARCQSVVTSRNDNARTGANVGEVYLNVQNVNPRQFGQLFRYRVQGNIFAQPLIVNGVQTADGVRNVVYVATSDDMVYAFDADSNTRNGGLIWSRNLAATGPVSLIDYDGDNTVISLPTPILMGDPAHTFGPPPGVTLFQGNLGIVSTPVIDLKRRTMYLVARSKAGDKYIQALHALDITNGNNRPGSPHPIATEPLEDPKEKWLTFASIENQRAGLALVNDRVVVAWGGGPGESEIVGIQLNNVTPPRMIHGTYHGYVMAFDADKLSQVGCFTTGSTLASGAGIWQSGRAPVVDPDGNVYFFTGNGFDRSPLATDKCSPSGLFPTPTDSFGNSLVELNVNKLAKDGIHFEPATVTIANKSKPIGFTGGDDQAYRNVLQECDVDLGGSGPLKVPIPWANVLIGGGKAGFLHIFEKIGGKYQEVGAVKVYPQNTEDFAVGNQVCTEQGMHHVMGGPVVWSKGDREPFVYVSVETDAIRSFRLTENPRNLVAIMQTVKTVYGHPAAILSLSANGNESHTGILWASHADRDSQPGFNQARYDKAPGILRAYDAEMLNHELWNSNMCGDQDRIGYFAKFTPPTVANGKVFMATFSGELVVYGLLAEPRLCPGPGKRVRHTPELPPGL